MNQEWAVRYNNSANRGDVSKGLSIDNLGNAIVSGSSGLSPSSSEFVTIKYSDMGIQHWIANYQGQSSGKNNLNAMSIDNSNNVIVTGSSEDIKSGDDFATIKYNSSGAQQWAARYTNIGKYRDAAYGIAVDNLDNIYVTGESNDSLTVDYLTIKYNSSGVQQWVARHTDGIAYSIAISDSGDVFITGVGSGDIMTIKYNTLGIQQWEKRYNGAMNMTDVGERVAVDKQGNVYVSGSSAGDLYYSDYVTIKYSSSGIEQWIRRYNGSDNYLDEVHDMIIDKSGNVYVTGNSTETGTGYDYTTIKYNTNGDQLWIAKYNYSLNDIAFAIALDSSDNVYVTGQSDGPGGINNYATVKYNSSGVQQWSKRYYYPGSNDDHAYAIAVDNNGSVFVTGQSDRDILTIKYSQLTGINTSISQIPSEFKLEQNSPNPFNPSTAINYSLSGKGFVSLKVYDVLGNEIATLVNEKQNSGIYNYQFSTVNYQMSSGVYFYRLMVDGNLIDTKRMLLLK